MGGGHDKLCKLFWRVNIFSAPGMGKLVGQNKNAPALPPPPPSNLCTVPKRVASADYQTEFEIFFSDFTRIVEFVSLGCPIQESGLVTGRFDLFQRQFLNAGYPKRFISYTVNSFLQVHPKMTILSRVFFLKSVRRFSSSSLTAKEMKNLAKLLSLS